MIAGALGECVHVAGVMKFLRLAEQAGWRTVFLGPAVTPESLIAAVREHTAQIAPGDLLVGVSYRLTPETGERLLAQFAEQADELHTAGVRFVFGGVPELARRAQALGFFDQVFAGGEPEAYTLAYLRGQTQDEPTQADFPQTTIERIRWKAPYPLLRHHFGLPSLAATQAGIARIAEAQALDVISLGIDQDAQANFFHPERQDPRRTGAGGAPVRSAQDYQALYEASRRGNYPLLRTYAGTDDFLRLAQMYVETINIAWCAIPLFWFNQMDGRGPWDLTGSIREHQDVMAWYGQRGIPVELNEPHHWAMRDAPDVLFVVAAYLAAYNARAQGVGDYIAQWMFNSPAGISDRMDLAKMLAGREIIAPLQSAAFHIFHQTRTGLLSYPLDPFAARAHLAASIYVQMALRPEIVHVVAHVEADHAATAEDVIEACTMARQVIENALAGQPDLAADHEVQARKAELLAEAAVTLQAIRELGAAAADPFTDPETLARAVRLGILDAPHLGSNLFARGAIRTRIDARGACIAVDDCDRPLPESARLADLGLE